MTRILGFKSHRNMISIPPLAEGIVLKDRDDGTNWLISYTQNPGGPDGEGYITITDTWPIDITPRIYDPYEGPYVANDDASSVFGRIFVRGGYLGVDVLPYPQGIKSLNSDPVEAIKGLSHRLRIISQPPNWTSRLVRLVLQWTPEVLQP